MCVCAPKQNDKQWFKVYLNSIIKVTNDNTASRKLKLIWSMIKNQTFVCYHATIHSMRMVLDIYVADID